MVDYPPSVGCATAEVAPVGTPNIGSPTGLNNWTPVSEADVTLHHGPCHDDRRPMDWRGQHPPASGPLPVMGFGSKGSQQPVDPPINPTPFADVTVKCNSEETRENYDHSNASQIHKPSILQN